MIILWCSARIHCRRKLDRISEEDVKIAISKVHMLGAGFQLLEYGSNTLVVSVPTELSSDHTAILQLAQSTSFVTPDRLKTHLQWEDNRIKMAIDLMMKTGMIWVDTQAHETVYWFVSLWQQSRLVDPSPEEATGGAAPK
jgi:ESCRT-II complex subunit VPS22